MKHLVVYSKHKTVKTITVVLCTCLCKRSSQTDSKISRMQPLDPDNKTISTTPALFLDNRSHSRLTKADNTCLPGPAVRDEVPQPSHYVDRW